MTHGIWPIYIYPLRGVNQGDIVNSLKFYLLAFGSAILAGFIGVFKYRGNKIDRLEKDIENVDKALESQKKKSSFERENLEKAGEAENEKHTHIPDGNHTL